MPSRPCHLPPQSERTAVYLRLPNDLATRLRVRAAETRETQESICARAIERELDRKRRD